MGQRSVGGTEEKSKGKMATIKVAAYMGKFAEQAEKRSIHRF